MAAQKAGEIARSQFWAISRRQLLAAGFSPARIDRWLASGRLHLRYPGVYAWGRPELSEKGEHAAALLFSSGAGGSGLTGLSGLLVAGAPGGLRGAGAQLAAACARQGRLRQGHPLLSPLTAEGDAQGPVGSRALRSAMAAHLPALARCIPIPQPNVRKGRFVPDMTWEQAKLIVELDGKDAHTSEAEVRAGLGGA